MLGITSHDSPQLRPADADRRAPPMTILTPTGRRVPVLAEGPDMSFAGKVVLVTGSTSGIGEACARLFAESGAAVMVSGRDGARGRSVVESIAAAGGKAGFSAADLRAAGPCDRLVADPVERLGGVEGLGKK